jgi:hypothetical protein
VTLPLTCDELGIVCDPRKRAFRRIAWDSILRIGFAAEDSICALASLEYGQNLPVTFYLNDPPPGQAAGP